MIQNAKNSGEEVRFNDIPSRVLGITCCRHNDKRSEIHFYSSMPGKIKDFGVTQNSTRTFMCPLISTDLAISYLK